MQGHDDIKRDGWKGEKKGDLTARGWWSTVITVSLAVVVWRNSEKTTD
jgi:hypothetical protein